MLTALKQLFKTQPRNKEQLIDILREAELKRIIDNPTLAMVESAINIKQLCVRDILLPKNQMVSLKKDMTFSEIIDIITETGHSRYPVFNESENELMGILHAKNLLKFTKEDQNQFDLHDLVREAPVVPESKHLDKLLAEFKTERNHMAMVVDEYGTVVGFVTIEDIIEQIIGDIEDEFDIDEETYIKNHNDAFYIIKAQTPIEIFNETMNADFSDEVYDTIGGIITSQFSYLPKRGEHKLIDGFDFKIISANARRIKLIACVDRREPVSDDNISDEQFKSEES